MNRYKAIYYFALFALLLLTACQDNDSAEQGNTTSDADGKVAVRLHLRVAGQDSALSINTRADWSDPNATDDEMMNVWTIVAVYNDANNTDTYGKIAFIHASVPEEGNREIDDLVRMTPGKYKFYSFANIDTSWLNGYGFLGYHKFAKAIFDDGTLSEEFQFPVNFLEIVNTSYTIPSGKTPTGIYEIQFDHTYDEGYFEVDDVTIEVDGNGFDPNSSYDLYGLYGIPMSNVQEIEISGESEVELIVVRMMAKIEVQLYNESGEDIVVKSATLSDVTQNEYGNIKLLPTLTYNADMNYHHKDIQPSVDPEASVAGFTYTPTTAETVPAHYGYDDNKTNPTHKLTFYVNESATPKNVSGLFFLTLEMQRGDNPIEYRHALINQKGNTSTDDDAWDYIARNDYRIIPVILTDWQFRIEPIAFVPIAGYPATTLSSDALTATFSTGGIIALQPYVKKNTDTTWLDFSNPEVEVISISWKNSDGTNVSGDNKIVKTGFAYDNANHCIIGELNQDKVGHEYGTSITVKVKLGSTGSEYTYSFTCNVILQ